MARKLMYQTHYELPYKEQMRADRQTSNDPLQDGFTCSEMVHHQPSEISNMDMWDGMDAESENLDIERTR